jgi:hypothetical protein
MKWMNDEVDLSEYFKPGPLKGHLHIIVKVPSDEYLTLLTLHLILRACGRFPCDGLLLSPICSTPIYFLHHLDCSPCLRTWCDFSQIVGQVQDGNGIFSHSPKTWRKQRMTRMN